MKNREEYLTSIYAKRDKELIKRKKKISAITSVACLFLCFIAVFSFVPKKKLGYKASVAENGKTYNELLSATNNADKSTVSSEEIFSSNEKYQANINQNNNIFYVDDSAAGANPIDSGVKATVESNKAETEIAVEIPGEATTRQVNFGYAGEPFDPEKLSSPSEDYVTEVSEPYPESPDSADEATIKSTTKAKLRSSDEAIEEALKYIPEEDTDKILENETHVTISRTSGGKSTYTVYFYTDSKTFSIELNAVTLEMIECKEKDKNTGNANYYTPAHFPETTAALPEYIP